jgi:hypothetical protein
MINETRVVETNRVGRECGTCGKVGCECGTCCPKRKCLSWSAVIAGAVVAFVISFLLNLFGVAIGLSAFTNTQTGVQAIAIGGFVGLIIIAIVCMYVGGMVSGYLGRTYCDKRNLGALYGILAFGVALFFAILFASPMSHFVSNYNDGLYGRSEPAKAVIANPMSDTSTVVSKSGVNTNAPAMNSKNSTAAAATEENANDLGKAAFLTFILFAIGAFSACLGGHHGMTCKCRDEHVCLNNKENIR